VSTEVELRMLESRVFQTVGTAMLKPREAKVVRTCGTNRRVVCRTQRTCGSVTIEQRT